MSKKTPRSGIVYSTDPDFKPEEDAHEEENISPADLKIRVFLETKHRAGKMVTVVSGFRGKAADFDDLARKIKVLCGTGGSAKDGEIIIQGDHREKITQWLLKNGFKNVKKM